MSTKEAKFPPLVPHLTVQSVADVLGFYERAFGATVTAHHRTPDGKKTIHAALQLENGGTVMLCDDFPEMSGGKSRTPQALGGSAVAIHLDLPDVDATWARAVAAGAEIAMALADQFWGDRYGVLIDPAGHRWSLATRQRVPSEAEHRAGVEQHFPKRS